MLFSRALRSQALSAGGRLAMYSGVCRERVVNRLQKPMVDGVKRTFGG